MKNLFFLYRTIIFLLLFSCGKSITHQNWKKGNLHTHSFWSDGDDFPEMIIQWYKDHDYQFVALSDHNIIADSEFWYTLRERDIKNKTLEKYQNRFGDWVEIKKDSVITSVRLKTFEEFKSKLEVIDSFLIIKSEEVTSSFEEKPVHMNVTNIQEKINPPKGQSVLDIMQQTINAVIEQSKKLNLKMFTHINHPNFGYGVSVEDIKKLNDERFFEVYNGHPAVNNEGDDMHIDTETMWDLINIHYYDKDKPLMYGIATDDSHNYHTLSSEHSNSGRGWVMVNSKKLNPKNLIIAMENGDFYSSTGIYLKTIFANKHKLFIEINPEEKTNYEIIFMGYKKGSNEVVQLKKVQGTSASYYYKKDDIFIRARINSDAKKENPYRLNETKKAWTQPFITQ